MPRSLGGIAAAVAVVVALGLPAHADPTPPAAPPAAPATPAPGDDSGASKPSEAPLPSCLDETIKDELGEQIHPRGVQKKNFLKRGHIDVVLRAGLYGGDLTSSNWIAGGSLGFFPTEDFGFEASFDVTPLTLDLDQPLTKFFGDNRFEPGMAYVALGNAIWSPIHAKLKIGGGIVHSDIMLFAGGGRMFHDAVQGLSFDAGAAIDLFVTQVFTIRLDIRDLTAIEEIAGDTRFTNNLIATAGLVVWIPTGL